MSDLLEHLSKDTLPDPLLKQFVEWCVWEQARPALVDILNKTGLDEHGSAIAQVDDLLSFAQMSETAGKSANEARKKTGPFGLSTAEAAAFLAHKLAMSAMDENFDAEEVAFYAAQMCAWSGFAETGFSDPQAKQAREAKARKEQEQQLRILWKQYGVQGS